MSAKWVRQAPTVPGWYWMRVESESGGHRVIPMRVRDDGRILASAIGGELSIDVKILVCEWWPTQIKEPPQPRKRKTAQKAGAQ